MTRLLKHASPASHAVETSDTQYASRNADFLNTIFEDESNRKAFLQKSSLFERVYRTQHHPFPALDKKQQQESAKLHCLYGKPILETGRLRSARTYPYACSKVYDIRQYTNRTRWGPFMDEAGDLKVDWEKVEAILIVLGSNIYTKKLTRLFNDVWDSPFSGSWKGSFISSPITDQSSLDAMDPYGVTGTWYRVCYPKASLEMVRAQQLTLVYRLYASLTTTTSLVTTSPTPNETNRLFTRSMLGKLLVLSL